MIWIHYDVLQDFERMILIHYDVLQEMLMIEIDVGSGCFAINGIVTLDSSCPSDILSSFIIIY